MATLSEVMEISRRSDFEPLPAAAEAVHAHLEADEQIKCNLPVDFYFKSDGTSQSDAFVAVTDMRILVYRYPAVWTGDVVFKSYPFADLTGSCDLRENRQEGVDYTKSWNKPYLQFVWELLAGAMHGVFLRNEVRATTLKNTFESAFNTFSPIPSNSTPQ